MMLEAPLWSVLLINIGFAALLYDGIVGRLPRWALLFPLLWFGGYEMAAIVSHREADSLFQQASDRNAQAVVPEVARGNDLIIRGYDYELDPAALLSMYGLSHIFVADRSAMEEKLLRKGACPGEPTYSAPGMPAPSFAPAADIVLDYDDRGYGGRSFVPAAETLCLETRSANPSGPATEVRLGSKKPRESILVNTITQTADVRWTQGGGTTLTHAEAVPLAWFPLPVLGCALDDGRSSWLCGARFLKDRPDVTPSIHHLLVAKLGLRRRSLRDRYPDAGWKMCSTCDVLVGDRAKP
jgi:hypothetical protein